jgi:hypothetical protein
MLLLARPRKEQRVVVKEEDLEPIEGLSRRTLGEARLAEELVAVRERNQVLEARLEQLNQALLSGRREEALLEDLLELRRDGGHAQWTPTASAAATPDASRSKPVEVSHPVVAASIDVLNRAGRPMHIQELMATLKEKEVEIPGSGDQANLISYLRRDSRIVRPARGLYGLRVWGLEDIESKPKPKPKSKKRSAKRTSRAKKK